MSWLRGILGLAVAAEEEIALVAFENQLSEFDCPERVKLKRDLLLSQNNTCIQVGKIGSGSGLMHTPSNPIVDDACTSLDQLKHHRPPAAPRRPPHNQHLSEACELQRQ